MLRVDGHNTLNSTALKTVEWKCRIRLSGALVVYFDHLPVYNLITYAICLLKILVRNSNSGPGSWKAD